MTLASAVRRRAGFTLLEVLLAGAISVLLMGGLYVAMDVQLRQTQEGRDVVERETLVRGVVNRLTADLTPALTPVAQKSASGGAGGGTGGGAATTPTAGGGGGAGATGGSGATGGGGTGAGGASGGGSVPTGGSTPTAGGTEPTTVDDVGSVSSGPISFQSGLIGDASTVTLFVTRVPEAGPIDGDVSSGSGASETPGDSRRITYWLATSGRGGLARHEMPWLTSEEAMASLQPDLTNEAAYVIAEEVKALSFEYFDGTAWQTSWDGSSPGPDGMTPLGPPLAIAVRLEIEAPSSGGGEPFRKTIRQVIAVPTGANNTPPPETTTETMPQ